MFLGHSSIWKGYIRNSHVFCIKNIVNGIKYPGDLKADQIDLFVLQCMGIEVQTQWFILWVFELGPVYHYLFSSVTGLPANMWIFWNVLWSMVHWSVDWYIMLLMSQWQAYRWSWVSRLNDPDTQFCLPHFSRQHNCLNIVFSGSPFKKVLKKFVESVIQLTWVAVPTSPCLCLLMVLATVNSSQRPDEVLISASVRPIPQKCWSCLPWRKSL